MVMRRNMMRKNLYRSVLRSLGRYIAIVAIIALGAAMFVGLLMTKSDMVATGQVFTRQQNMFDLRLVSTYGWDLEDVEKIAGLDAVEDVEGQIYLDLIVRTEEADDESVYRVYAIPEIIDRVDLRAGRMPERPDECVIDGYKMDDSVLGTTITVAEGNSEDSLEAVRYRTFTIVGFVASPLYMDMNRGTTSVGNGSIANCIYVLPDALDVDYYTEIHVTIPGEYDLYSEAYNSAMDAAGEQIKPLIQPVAQARLDRLRQEAEDAYADGMKEYEDGVKELAEAREEAEKELADAYNKLIEAEETIAKNEQALAAAEGQIAAGWSELLEGEKTLKDSKAQLESAKATAYEQIDNAQGILDSSCQEITGQIAVLDLQLAPIDQEMAALKTQIEAVESQYSELAQQISQLESQITRLDGSIDAMESALQIAKLLPGVNEALIAQLEAAIGQQSAQRAELQEQLAVLKAQAAPYESQLEAPRARYAELEDQREELALRKQMLQMALETAQQSRKDLEVSRTVLDEQFAATEAEIVAGEAQLAAGRQELNEAQWQLEHGRQQLEEGKKELEDGWKEYNEGKAQAETELADAEQKLADAKEELADARALIDEMDVATVHVLDRNTNVGYNSLDSASDIVAGVSRVFPAFFLLVAALVCITTMTRMIEEERTQIGTLKALGYSNAAIIGKYLIYSGSGAVIGCGLGVAAGSYVFPKILWEAYKIMLYITDDLVLRFNWLLSGAVVLAYAAVMLFVTWYCCRRVLKEEPAELIRPKAPDAGKKILLEYLPFWNKLSFLNKVTIRNIFRYRQRLAMMIVGIGGCTALLVTGYGLRDSITNVVDYQFREVTTYDMSVYFDGDQTVEAQEQFRQEIRYDAEAVLFYHQSSVELDHDDHTKELYMISAGPGIREFIDFHKDKTKLDLPGKDEMLLSSGIAEAMGIAVGDEVILRDADMRTLTLTVCGIYENHVDNYAIVSPETIEGQWGQLPQLQMAFVKVQEDADAYALSALIAGMDGVMNVSVSQDLADMVGGMMEALDLVVWVIVFCAGLLAAIVLYNLTNININERIREIATVKVLGFNAGETAAYVFKENLSLTAIGSILGLGLGYLLLVFVMSQIKIDMVWFKVLIKPVSYLISLVLTMLAAGIVDLVFYFKLDKINMAEALKSVE